MLYGWKKRYSESGNLLEMNVEFPFTDDLD